MAKNREAGMLEIIDDLMGHPNFGFDTGHTFINMNRGDTRNRMLKPLNQQTQEGQACLENFYDTYYPKRPDSLEKFILLNIMTHFDCVSSGKKKAPTDFPQEDEEHVTAGNSNATPFASEFNGNDEMSLFYQHPSIPDGTLIQIPSLQFKCLRKLKPTVPRLFVPVPVHHQRRKIQTTHRSRRPNP